MQFTWEYEGTEMRGRGTRSVRKWPGSWPILVAAIWPFAGLQWGARLHPAGTQVVAGIVAGQKVSPRREAAMTTPPAPPVIVVGFVGGYVKHNDLVHSVVQVAARLRRDYATGVDVAIYENHRREEAYQEILRILDENHRGTPSEAEKKSARIVIYGHSWGASETVTLARELANDGIPVLLTIQVDSVSKRGQDDGTIPANVAQAVNFYQLDGTIHGRPQIRASDPARTKILGNYQFEYKEHPLACEQYPWYNRLFMKAHTEIECDPRVWDRVETLIRSQLPSSSESPPRE